jgi:hypothetical protein
MKTPIIAIAAAIAWTGAAFAQTAAPTSTAPSASSPDKTESGSSMTPGLDSSKATSTAGPSGTNPYPMNTGKSKDAQPGGTMQPYIVPAHPRSSSGDDGGTAGKTNPD